MNNLYEALEICLQDIEQGADMETVLFRYPDLADELRPILEASAKAKGMAAPPPSEEVLRRYRAKLLQHAAQMRESQAGSVSRRGWFASLRRVVVTLVVIAILFVSGTGLVRAASTTLPGDDLYPVKRTWEDVRLLFTLNMRQRETLEVEHENERLEELNELFAEGRSEEVDFAGLVMQQNGDQWLVAGIPVVISPQTEIRDQPIAVGDAIRVRGVTQGDGIVLAERIRLLSPGENLPDIEHEPETEKEKNEGPDHEDEGHSGQGSDGESSQVEEVGTPEFESENSGSNSGSGLDSSDYDDSGNEDNSGQSSSDDGNGGDGNDNESNNNDNSGSDDNSHDDNNSEENSNDGGNTGSGGGGEDEGEDR